MLNGSDLSMPFTVKPSKFNDLCVSLGKVQCLK